MEMHTVKQLVGGKRRIRNQGSRLQSQGCFNRLALLRLRINLPFLQPRFCLGRNGAGLTPQMLE